MRARSIANFFVLALALAVVWFMVAPLFLERQEDGAAGQPENGCGYSTKVLLQARQAQLLELSFLPPS